MTAPTAAEQRYRPLGSPCLHCLVRPARPDPRYPNLATGYCSVRHKIAAGHKRERDRRRALANEMRSILGLPSRQSADFSAPELEAVVRRLRRLLPYEGLAVYPATRYEGHGAPLGRRGRSRQRKESA